MALDSNCWLSQGSASNCELRPGFHYVHDSFVIQTVDSALGGYERGVFLAQTLGPKKLAGCGRKAVRYTAVGYYQEVITLNDRRGHIGGALRGAPGDVGLCHVPSSIRADGEDVVVGKPSRDKDQSAPLAVNG